MCFQEYCHALLLCFREWQLGRWWSFWQSRRRRRTRARSTRRSTRRSDQWFLCFRAQLIHCIQSKRREAQLNCASFPLHPQFLDHLLTGIECICGHYGHHHWKDKYVCFFYIASLGVSLVFLLFLFTSFLTSSNTLPRVSSGLDRVDRAVAAHASPLGQTPRCSTPGDSCAAGWIASTRPTWRSGWLRANAPPSLSSSPSTTRWRWNRPWCWWRAGAPPSCRLLCRPCRCSKCNRSLIEIDFSVSFICFKKKKSQAAMDFYEHLSCKFKEIYL